MEDLQYSIQIYMRNSKKKKNTLWIKKVDSVFLWVHLTELSIWALRGLILKSTFSPFEALSADTTFLSSLYDQIFMEKSSQLYRLFLDYDLISGAARNTCYLHRIECIFL